MININLLLKNIFIDKTYIYIIKIKIKILNLKKNPSKIRIL